MPKRRGSRVLSGGILLVVFAMMPLACDALLALQDPHTNDEAFAEAGPPPRDARDEDGMSDVGYPAFRPKVPQMVLGDEGGILAAPTARAVVFPGDDEATYTPVDTALKEWVGSGLWMKQLMEYGILKVTIEAPVMVPADQPTTLTDGQIQAWLGGQLDGGHPEFGDASGDALSNEAFVLFYPASTTITTDGGKSCKDFIGYHSAFVVDVRTVFYAVVPNCGGTAASLTKSASMLGIATVSDPHPAQYPGYASFDPDHLAWNYLNASDASANLDSTVPRAELPQPCAGEDYVLPDSGLPIVRSWSNASMAGYHDPCVPDSGSAYFASVPVMNDWVMLPGPPGKYPTKGVGLRVGEPKTIEVELLSDGPTQDWTVGAEVLKPFKRERLKFSFDGGRRGRNGDVLHLTITATSAEPTPFAVTSTLDEDDGGTKRTTWVGLAGPGPGP